MGKSRGESWGRIEQIAFWLIIAALLVVGLVWELGVLIKRAYDWCRGRKAPETVDRTAPNKEPERKGFGFGGI